MHELEAQNDCNRQGRQEGGQKLQHGYRSRLHMVEVHAEGSGDNESHPNDEGGKPQYRFYFHISCHRINCHYFIQELPSQEVKHLIVSLLDMKTETNMIGSAIAAKMRLCVKRQNKNPDKIPARNFSKAHTAEMMHNHHLLEFPYQLIDYTNCNEVLKRKDMTLLKAWELNKLLKGSGMAWAKSGYG